MNLTATQNIQRSLSGWSKTFPNSRSTEVYSFRNLPATRASTVAPTSQSSVSKRSMPSPAQLRPTIRHSAQRRSHTGNGGVRTLHLNAPSDPAPLTKVLAVAHLAVLVREALNERWPSNASDETVTARPSPRGWGRCLTWTSRRGCAGKAWWRVDSEYEGSWIPCVRRWLRGLLEASSGRAGTYK